MKTVDRWLQSWREGKVRKWLKPGARVLDIGCHQGEFLEKLGASIGRSVGLDPLATPRETARYQIVAKPFAEPVNFPDHSFDAIILLATLEHIRDKAPLAREARRPATRGA